jgi:RNA-binding protein YhbY
MYIVLGKNGYITEAIIKEFDTAKIEQYIKIRTVQEALEDALSKYKD